MVIGKELVKQTRGFSDVVDITRDVNSVIAISNGIVCIAVIGSTASVTTIEYEPALVADFKDKLEELAAHDKPTRHGDTWGDENGFSHLRASLMGPGITLPVQNGQVVLGTWQQIVLVDHDNRPRERKIVVQMVGE